MGLRPHGERLATELLMRERIMAFMLWPKRDEVEKRKVADRHLAPARLTQALQRTVSAHASGWTLQDRVRPAYQAALIKGLTTPWFPELMLGGADHIARYVTASLVAYYAMAVQAHASTLLRPNAGVGVACAIVNEFGGLNRRPKHVLIHKNAQGAMIDWSLKKRAAHFWAAYLVMKVDAPEREPVFDDFRTFIGIARHFRRVLQGTLIRSKDLLALPKDFRYPFIERTLELDQEVVALLPFYKADGDLGPRFELALKGAMAAR